MSNQAYLLSFASIGKDVVIWQFARIINSEVISLANSIIIDDFVFLMGGIRTYIGNFVHIGSHTSIAGGGELVMDDFSGLSGGVRIYTGNEDYIGGSLTNPTVPYPYRIPIRSFVHIERHAIVGANAVILPGVTIREGAVVGANSLVTKDCEPWMIYVGTPAKPLSPRPNQKIIELEQQLRKELFDAEGNYISKSTH